MRRFCRPILLLLLAAGCEDTPRREPLLGSWMGAAGGVNVTLVFEEVKQGFVEGYIRTVGPEMGCGLNHGLVNTVIAGETTDITVVASLGADSVAIDDGVLEGGTIKGTFQQDAVRQSCRVRPTPITLSR